MPTRPRGTLLVVFLAGLALGACSSEGGGEADITESGGADTVAVTDTGTPPPDVLAADVTSTDVPPGPLSPASVVAAWSELFATVAASLDEPQYFHDDTWHAHFGDGLMFGPSYDLASWAVTESEAQRQRAVVTLDGNRAMVAAATTDLFGAMDDLENIAMAQLGLLEAGQFDDTLGHVDTAEAFIDVVDVFAAAFDDYMAIDAGEFAATTYGPTSISSFLALMHLELALAHPSRDRETHLARADEILQHIHDAAWDDEMGAFRFAPGDERRMLYPNATMMLAYGRALQLTGDARYQERIEAIFAGIQPLRAASGDHYHSPYSREESGAVDEDYATLSSQNYLMIALWLAYQGTGELRYLEELHAILGWIESHLFVDGVLKHHWVNGRTADARDGYDFCSGCNLQTLYILRVVELASDAPTAD